jgi:ribosomal protein S18 acetylase RimI-like enzyme
MINYRKSKVSDSNQIAEIHIKSFPNFFLTTLGYSFLKTYYRSCAKSKEAISICAINQDDKNLLGFAVGCFNSAGFNKRLILSNLLEYSYRALLLLFTKPIALIRLYKNLSKNNDKGDKGNYAELLSIGVSPDQNGFGIGQQLLTKFENQVREKGINKVTLTTDADSNDSVLRFYKKSGYTVYYDFETFPNRKMLKLIKEL